MKRTIANIVIHCSATPNGKDLKAKDIDVWHKQRSFKRSSQATRNFNPYLPNIGYHAVIELDGNIALGRHLEEVGAHVQGNNSNSIGVCLIGMDDYSDAQWLSLRQYLITLASQISGKPHSTISAALESFNRMNISIKGHRDYSPDLNGDGQITRNEWIKTCPGFNVSDWIKTLKD